MAAESHNESPYAAPNVVDAPELQRPGIRQRTLIEFLSTLVGVVTACGVMAATSLVTLYSGWHVAYLFLGITAGPALGILVARIFRRMASIILGVKAPGIQDEAEPLRRRLENELEEFHRVRSVDQLQSDSVNHDSSRTI